MSEAFEHLYIHFPFCEAKCHYCDFFSLPEEKVFQKERNRIYFCIAKEINSFKILPLRTVFMGGGTPSLVPLTHMEDVLGKLPLTSQTEVTLEANPSSVNIEKARAWRSFGINRVSLGVQALNDERLLWLGRVHSKKEVFRALEVLFEAGFPRVSIDYIVGVPQQTCEDIEEELRGLLKLFPKLNHISAYLLTLKNSNIKFKDLPSEQIQLQHLQTVRSVLIEFGFEQYEISNFAREDARALHNENTWTGGAYLGIGPSSHSFYVNEKKRIKNWASLDKYCSLIEQGALPQEWIETLSPEQQRLEYILLRLRRKEGIDLQDYSRRFGCDLYQESKASIDLWVEKGLCALNVTQFHSKLKLTADGFFLSDEIIRKLCHRESA